MCGLVPHLVPAAVVLRGGTVVLQHFGDGALVDALQVQLPLSKLQETAAKKEPKPVSLWNPKAFLVSTAPRQPQEGTSRTVSGTAGVRQALGKPSKVSSLSFRPLKVR